MSVQIERKERHAVVVCCLNDRALVSHLLGSEIETDDDGARDRDLIILDRKVADVSNEHLLKYKRVPKLNNNCLILRTIAISFMSDPVDGIEKIGVQARWRGDK